SDTHGFLDEKVFKYFADCDEIWHAGDIGSEDIFLQLKEFKRFKAVYGNIDGLELRTFVPEIEVFQIEGLKILITHIAGSPPRYNSKVKKLIKTLAPNILICGHSHILRVLSDKDN